MQKHVVSVFGLWDYKSLVELNHKLVSAVLHQPTFTYASAVYLVDGQYCMTKKNSSKKYPYWKHMCQYITWFLHIYSSCRIRWTGNYLVQEILHTKMSPKNLSKFFKYRHWTNVGQILPSYDLNDCNAYQMASLYWNGPWYLVWS